MAHTLIFRRLLRSFSSLSLHMPCVRVCFFFTLLCWLPAEPLGHQIVFLLFQFWSSSIPLTAVPPSTIAGFFFRSFDAAHCPIRRQFQEFVMPKRLHDSKSIISDREDIYIARYEKYQQARDLSHFTKLFVMQAKQICNLINRCGRVHTHFRHSECRSNASRNGIYAIISVPCGSLRSD